MGTQSLSYGEIEIGLHRFQPEAYDVEVRVVDPDSDGEVGPVRGQSRISIGELRPLEDNYAQYGEALAAQLFEHREIREFYLKNKAAFESRGLILRLRLLIGPSVPELHSLRWELLSDPETKLPLATSERVLFSRFMLSRDWRVVKLRPKARLKALIAIAGPTNAGEWGLADIDKAGEVERAREALAGIQATVVGLDQPLTLVRLMDAIRQGTDVLYLVCHGAMPKGQEPCLYLQKEEGNIEVVLASALAQRIGELAEVPRLIVLASCESAGHSEGDLSSDRTIFQSAFAPRLAEAGIPAVVAMQGKISMETVKQAMPVFFHELLKDGQIDRAMAVARGTVRERNDSWMPALFMRLKSGRIWYEPGFGGEGKNEEVQWDSICRSVANRDLVPIIGPDLAEHIYGTSRTLAADLAHANGFTLSPFERPDIAKIAQFVTTKSAPDTLRDQLRQLIREQLVQKATDLGIAEPAEMPTPELMLRVVEKLSEDEDEPFRILSSLDAKVYITGAADPLLKIFLKKAGKFPVELVSDWRNECTVDQDRLVQAASDFCERIQAAPGGPIEQITNEWRDSLLRPGESSLPVSLESAADRLEELLADDADKPPANVAEQWRNAIIKPLTDTPARPLPKENPLIYYVYGKIRYKETWVLTEDDFFDYLIRNSSYPLMPRIIADKLVAGSLLFLGFPLDDWKFRVLFRMIMSKDGKGLLKKFYHIGVQVDPEEHTQQEANRIRSFLEKYFGDAANINIYWGSGADFLKSLRDHLKDPKYRTSAAKVSTLERRWG